MGFRGCRGFRVFSGVFRGFSGLLGAYRGLGCRPEGFKG